MAVQTRGGTDAGPRLAGGRTLGVAATLAVLAASAIVEARSEPLDCTRTIAHETSRLVKAELKALQECEDSILKGDVSCQCPDGRTAAKIARARFKYEARIARACAGADKVCGTSDDNLDMQVDAGFPAFCPDFESSGLCAHVIADCGDVAACVECIVERGITQAIALYYDALVPSDRRGHKELNECQRAIGRETSKFLLTKEKALRRCWDARLKGEHNAPCPDPGDGEAATTIARAHSKKVAKICRQCGGADTVCGTLDDLSPDAIGFVGQCDDVTIPGGPSCAGPVDDLQDLLDCVDCVTDFKLACIDASRVPLAAAYPSECNQVSTPGPTATGPPPTPTATPLQPTPTASTEPGSTPVLTPTPPGGPPAPTATATPCAGTVACGLACDGCVCSQAIGDGCITSEDLQDVSARVRVGGSCADLCTVALDVVAVDFDTASFSGDAQNLRIPSAGKYLIAAEVRNDPGDHPIRLDIVVNGGPTIVASGSGPVGASVTTLYELAADDLVGLQATHLASGTLSVAGGSLSIMKVP